MATRADYTSARRLVKSGLAEVVSATTISSNQRLHTSTTETALISETIGANELDSANLHFRVTLAGEISSTGTGDATLLLKYGSTTILTITTVSLVDEDDKQWKLEIVGRIHTTGATGKVVASGRMDIEQATPLLVVADTAAAGVTVDLTAGAAFQVTADWDASSADNDIIAMVGFIEWYK